MTSPAVGSSTGTSNELPGHLVREAPPTSSNRFGVPGGTHHHERHNDVKVKPSVKPICEKCKVIRRNGRVMVICDNLRHKQRQG